MKKNNLSKKIIRCGMGFYLALNWGSVDIYRFIDTAFIKATKVLTFVEPVNSRGYPNLTK